ncbi:hypothetical protein E2320_006355, partial [Naja naja]
MSLGKGGESS